MSHNHRNIKGVVEKITSEHFELDESLEKVIWFKLAKYIRIFIAEFENLVLS